MMAPCFFELKHAEKVVLARLLRPVVLCCDAPQMVHDVVGAYKKFVVKH